MSKYFATNVEVRAYAERFATGLGLLGLPKGARILFRVPQMWESVAFIWACLGSKLVPVPMSPHSTEYEIARTRDDLSPAIEIHDSADLGRLLGATGSDFDPIPHCRPLHLTSGTTGRPKGVWSGWWDHNDAEAAFEEERSLWQLQTKDTNLVVSPLYHSAPLRFALNTVIAGGNLLVPAQFNLEEIKPLITKHRPTTMFCVPAHLKRFLSHQAAENPIDFSSFRLVAHAGAPCPVDVKKASISLFGVNVLTEFYGSTEGQFTICRSSDWLNKESGVGVARPNRTMFADEDDQLWCVVPPWGQFEYVGDKQRTRQAWRATEYGPAFTLGDLGRVDQDGWVHLDARRTDLIISGGVNLYPREIEAVIEEFPGIEEVAVVGLHDDNWGQKAVAVIVGSPDIRLLRQHLEARLTRTKIPKDFIFVKQIPHTATGKIQRHTLIDQIQGTTKG